MMKCLNCVLLLRYLRWQKITCVLKSISSALSVTALILTVGKKFAHTCISTLLSIPCTDIQGSCISLSDPSPSKLGCWRNISKLEGKSSWLQLCELSIENERFWQYMWLKQTCYTCICRRWTVAEGPNPSPVLPGLAKWNIAHALPFVLGWAF